MKAAQVTIEITPTTYWAFVGGFEGCIVRHTMAELFEVLDWCFRETGWDIVTVDCDA